MGILDKITKKEKKVKQVSRDKKKVLKKSKGTVYTKAHKFIKKPLITEKGTFLEAEGKYIFEVEKTARKKEISDAIKKIYGVHPRKVNIIRISGKKRRLGKNTGKTADLKKAIVTLEKGETIQVHEGV